MEEIKRIGNFIYQYQDNGEVALAKLGIYSNLAAQMAVNEKMFGKAEPTGYFRDLVYGQSKQPAVLFKGIEEDELVNILK